MNTNRREFLRGSLCFGGAAALAMSALGEGGRTGIRLRFLGTGAAGVWKGAPRRQSSVLLENATLIDFTACNLDMLPEGCRPDSILYTHSHGDHYDPVAALKLGVKRVYAHETWANCARRHFAEFGAKLGLPPPGQPVYITHMGVGYPDSADEIDKTLPAPLKAARDGLEVVLG